MKRVACESAAFGRLRAAIASVPVACLALGLLAACASKPATERFFALNDGAPVASAAVASSGPGRPGATAVPGIVISAVTVPELVDRPQIVTRDSGNRVLLSEDNLWAESVRGGIGRTLATRLTRTLGDAGRAVQVAAYPQTSIVDPVLRITVDIVRFDAEPNGQAVVEALWTIRRPADETIRSGHGLASAPVDGTSYEAIVGGWNRAVADIDRDIAAMVLEVGVEPPPPAMVAPAAAPPPAPKEPSKPRR